MSVRTEIDKRADALFESKIDGAIAQSLTLKPISAADHQRVYAKFVNFLNSVRTCRSEQISSMLEKRFSEWTDRDFSVANSHNLLISAVRAIRHPHAAEKELATTRWLGFLRACGHKP